MDGMDGMDDLDEEGLRQAVEADDFQASQGRAAVHSAPASAGEYYGHVETPQALAHHHYPGSSDGGAWRWRRRSSQRLVATDLDPDTDPAIIPFTQFASPLAVRAHIHPHSYSHPHSQPLTHSPNTPHPYPYQQRHLTSPHQLHSQSHLSHHSATADGTFGTMEQIETQASDLRFLAQVPVLNPASSPSLGPGSGAGRGGTPGRTPGTAIGASAGASIAYENQPSPSSASVGDNSAHGASANKRKSTDDGPGSAGKQTRSKRNRVSPDHFVTSTTRFQPIVISQR